MTIPVDPILTLHQIFSPAFPVGAFSYSHGAEAAAQEGALTSAKEVEAWLEDVLRHGSGWSDAVLLVQAAQGADVADLAAALAPSSERRLETTAQGAAFAACVREVWQIEVAEAAYPVAVGQTVAALNLPVQEAVRLYLQAFVSNIVGACQRLLPLGQTQAQAIIARLSPLCAQLAAQAMEADPDEIGGFVPLIDVYGQRQGALYSRIFRS